MLVSRRKLALSLFCLLAAAGGRSGAQISVPRQLSSSGNRTATLEEQLTNRLRATTDEQKAFLQFVVKQVEEEKLELRLVLAIERYALNRNRHLPFNFFERALRFEAGRRGVTLPPVQQFVTTRVTP